MTAVAVRHKIAGSAFAQANLNTGHVTLELEAPLAVSDLETAFGAPRRVYPDHRGAPVELVFSLPVAATLIAAERDGEVRTVTLRRDR